MEKIHVIISIKYFAFEIGLDGMAKNIHLIFRYYIVYIKSMYSL